MRTLIPRPDVECDQVHPALRVTDVRAAAEFYTARLGFTLSSTWDEPAEIAGVNLGNTQLFLELGTPGPGGRAAYFVVGDADALHEFQRANGVEVVIPPEDRHYGLRDYRIRDLNGYELSFGHRIWSGGEPLPIERVDVPVRLEKRLASLLADLAEHKRMTLSSCLEEILLHTNEPYDGGVACPHTPDQLRYIQRLKKKHGIDHDSHASYRFVER